jgi:hypothetical protein
LLELHGGRVQGGAIMFRQCTGMGQCSSARSQSTAFSTVAIAWTASVSPRRTASCSACRAIASCPESCAMRAASRAAATARPGHGWLPMSTPSPAPALARTAQISGCAPPPDEAQLPADLAAIGRSVP